MALMFFPDAPAALQALNAFLLSHRDDLPDFTREKVLEAAAHPSKVHAIAETAEALWAAHADLNKDGRDLCAQLAQFAAVNDWHGLSERGFQIAAAIQRIGGYSAPPGQSWPDPEDDPAPLDRYIAPPDIEQPAT